MISKKPSKPAFKKTRPSGTSYYAKVLNVFFPEILKQAKPLLRDYINATVGFEKLGTLTHKPAKSLMRMFGPKGNPRARNLFEIIAHLQKSSGLRLGFQQVSIREKKAS